VIVHDPASVPLVLLWQKHVILLLSSSDDRHALQRGSLWPARSASALWLALSPGNQKRKAGMTMEQPPVQGVLVVRRYWIGEGKPPLGYATYKYSLPLWLIGSILPIVPGVAFWILQAIPLAALSLFFLTIFGIILTTLDMRYSGWYQVDAAGNPIAFVSRWRPSWVHSRGLSRQQFLEQVGGAGSVYRGDDGLSSHQRYA
jgi:hypothetical protein